MNAAAPARQANAPSIAPIKRLLENDGGERSENAQGNDFLHDLELDRQ